MEEIIQPEPNPQIIQDRGRARLAELLENGNSDLLDVPPVDTINLPPGHQK